MDFIDRVFCKHCKMELDIDNIKDITLEIEYDTTEHGEIDIEVAHIQCSNCSKHTEVYGTIGELLKMDWEKAQKVNNTSDVVFDVPKVNNISDVGFGIPVCKKCGQLFCDCNLRCEICGQVFCVHKYRK